MLKVKVITQYTDRNLESAVNKFLSQCPGTRTVRDIKFSAHEDFYTAMVLYEEGAADSAPTA